MAFWLNCCQCAYSSVHTRKVTQQQEHYTVSHYTRVLNQPGVVREYDGILKGGYRKGAQWNAE